jgi:3-isopropylmalate dehydrogenase
MRLACRTPSTGHRRQERIELSQQYIAILPGDGIGPEVIAEARRVLEWFVARRGLSLVLAEHPYGAGAYRRLGQVLPKATEEAIRAAHAILLGAVGGTDTDAIPRAARIAGGLPHLRRSLELYANLRPIVTIPALYEASSLKNRVLEGVDFVIVRELIGGIYFGQPRGIESLPDGQRRGFNTQTYTTAEIRRIARFAFELARTRRRQVCSVDKANVMEAGVLWREEVQALRDAEFPDIELRHLYVDNCAMQLVRAPAQFDVIVTDNIFGDILSDCAAMAAGSLGMLPSASLGPADAGGRRAALYEPVHGSAPDIAGKGIANPLGAILSVAMMLRLSLGRAEDAALLERAVAAALAQGARTADICEPVKTAVSCGQMGAAVLRQLDLFA